MQVPTPPDGISLSAVPFYDFARQRIDFRPHIEDGGRPIIGYKFYAQTGKCTTEQCRTYRNQVKLLHQLRHL